MKMDNEHLYFANDNELVITPYSMMIMPYPETRFV
jgi:hypothetical protein